MAPASVLTQGIEHYWLNDWDFAEPLVQQILPHPTVNLVWVDDGPGLVFGPRQRMNDIRMAGRGRVFGVQLRPGGFRWFTDLAQSELSAEPVPVTGILGADRELDAALRSVDDGPRVEAVNRFLTSRRRDPGPANAVAMRLAHRARTDRRLTRVETLAATESIAVRTMQRMFAAEIGVTPKWMIARYRVQEAIELADGAVNWAALAVRLGYSDQAHLVRDFSRAAGVSPAAYARLLRAG